MTDHMPKFSIIIPVYNVVPYLRECLDSVLGQTFTDWEAICVDDGSTDGSGAILDEYRARDGRFSVIHKKNAGVSAARNAALDVARGEWVTFVDADDAIHPDWLIAAQRGAAHKNVDWVRLGIVYCGQDVVVSPAGTSVQDAPMEILGGTQDNKWLVLSRATFLVCNLYRREVIGECRFPVGLKLCEDVVFEESLLSRVGNICYVHFEGYYYRMRQDSAMRTVYDANQVLLYLSSVIQIMRNQLDHGLAVPARYATFRIEKDLRLYFQQLRLGVDRDKRQQIMAGVSKLQDIGAFNLRFLRCGYRYSWMLAIKTANCDFTLVDGPFMGLPKLLLYLFSGNRLAITSTRAWIRSFANKRIPGCEV